MVNNINLLVVGYNSYKEVGQHNTSLFENNKLYLSRKRHVSAIYHRQVLFAQLSGIWMAWSPEDEISFTGIWYRWVGYYYTGCSIFVVPFRSSGDHATHIPLS
jgi:hypothetical protein